MEARHALSFLLHMHRHLYGLYNSRCTNSPHKIVTLSSKIRLYVLIRITAEKMELPKEKVIT